MRHTLNYIRLSHGYVPGHIPSVHNHADSMAANRCVLKIYKKASTSVHPQCIILNDTGSKLYSHKYFQMRVSHHEPLHINHHDNVETRKNMRGVAAFQTRLASLDLWT